VIQGIVNYLINPELSNNTSNIIENKSKYIYFTEKTAYLQIIKFSDILNKIIPFFKKYPIIGTKRLDFEDFSKVASIVQSKEHLTQEGIGKILKIKSGMNQDRKF